MFVKFATLVQLRASAVLVVSTFQTASKPCPITPPRSQYLDRVPISGAKGRYCYYCNTYMQKSNKSGVQSPTTKSMDHILPRCVGTIPRSLDMDRFNKRPCCSDCNSFRSTLGHCAGLLMMTIIEGQRRGIDKREAAILLGILRSKAERKRLKRQRYLLRRGFGIQLEFEFQS